MNIEKEFSFLSRHPNFKGRLDLIEVAHFYFKGGELNIDLYIQIPKKFDERGVLTGQINPKLDEPFVFTIPDWFDDLAEQAKKHYKEKFRLHYLFVD